MGILGGDGFSLPIVNSNPIVSVSITITDSALSQMENTLNNEEKNHCLIISAQSGGCSGYVYDMKIDEIPQDKEQFQILFFGNIKIFIHNGDSHLLNGIELDYKDSLMGGGFNITNPNASRECGCGQSFG
ncbi:MAG: iron-sulfur cluster assembly accessory protein [Methanobacteriota archaeon]|nr:MAG: iron-sulfur cluster assembly accessory protein [Euryarchaeota archaeon]HIE63969.1 iron-sulfur cluster assembly accessory protein [Candidatus Poseidoniales archaeon]